MAFSFSSIGHAFASVAKEIVHVSKVVEAGLAKVQKSEAFVEAITAVIDPAAVPLERAAYAILGKALQVVHDNGDAAAANGVNIQLDSQEIADLKELIAMLKTTLATKGVVVK